MHSPHFLVTGGCGFIGSHLVDALILRGNPVTVLDDLSTGSLNNLNRHAEFIHGSVTDPKAVADALEGKTGCFHLAAIASVERSTKDWVGTHIVNQSATIRIFNQARAAHGRAAIPVVYASSAAVYGNATDAPIEEGAVLSPTSAYGADKLGSELHAKVAWLTHGVPSIGLRFFNVYGPRQSPTSPYSGVISVFLARIVNGKPVRINGDGHQVRDFIHVDDVVTHLLAAMSRAETGAAVYNVCTGRGTSIVDLAHTLCDAVGSDIQINYGPARVGDIRVSIGSPTLANANLGVKARVSLNTGLASLARSLTILENADER